MKKIDTLHDHVLDIPYDLYRVNARSIVARIRSQYNLPMEFIHTFNSETELGENLRRIKASEKRNHHDVFAINNIEKAKENIALGKYVSKASDIGISFGYESMPIAILAKGDLSNPKTDIELIDGFKRSFCTENIPDTDILVKVYKEMDDSVWINSMLLYNSWKFASNQGAKIYMDRGFQLGLYHRYNIDINDLAPSDDDIYTTVDTYTASQKNKAHWVKGSKSELTYQTLWNNHEFHNDLLVIHAISQAAPPVVVKKKKESETLTYEDARYCHWALYRMRELFIATLGSIRKVEMLNGIQKRVTFHPSIFEEFFREEKWQMHLAKIFQMSVDGFIVNYIKKNLEEDVVTYIFEKYGYGASAQQTQ